MNVNAALHFLEQFFDVQKSYRACFLLAVLAWFLQVMALGTYDWMKAGSSSMGLWTYCNYTATDFKCCQTLTSFLGKQHKIPRMPTWLSGALVFEILGLLSSLIFVVSCVVLICISDSKLRKKAKVFNYIFSSATVIFVAIGVLVYTGEYSSETWSSGARLWYSYGICVTSGIIHLICFLLLFVSSDNAVHALDEGRRWNGPVNAPGTNEFWEEILEHPTTPMHWTFFEGGYNVKKYLSLHHQFKTVKVTDQGELRAVKKLVESTWDSRFVGYGADAANIVSSSGSVFVTGVERIENVDLWDNYIHERAKLIRLFLKKGPFEKLENHSNRGAVFTARYMDSPLTGAIYPVLNEFYLFHGTKPQFVDNIVRRGMDPRHSGDRTMMGRGNYCAESSTKSDQYADYQDQRQSTGLKMLLVRMLLGNIHVAQSARQYKLPPCSTCLNNGKLKDNCTNKDHEHFDSVVADIQRNNFREFIVYNAHQCYPEYIITYDRC